VAQAVELVVPVKLMQLLVQLIPLAVLAFKAALAEHPVVQIPEMAALVAVLRAAHLELAAPA
jgi:hypothetical protein